MTDLGQACGNVVVQQPMHPLGVPIAAVRRAIKLLVIGHEGTEQAHMCSLVRIAVFSLIALLTLVYNPFLCVMSCKSLTVLMRNVH